MFAYCNNTPVKRTDAFGKDSISVDLLIVDESQIFYVDTFVVEVTVSLEYEATVSNNKMGEFVRQSREGTEFGLEDNHLSLSIQITSHSPSLAVSVKGKNQQVAFSYDPLMDMYRTAFTYENNGFSYCIDVDIYSMKPRQDRALEYAYGFSSLRQETLIGIEVKYMFAGLLYASIGLVGGGTDRLRLIYSKY